MVEPLEKLYTEENDPYFPCGLYLFKNPDPRKSYTISIDTAKGGAHDYHAAHVNEIDTGFQVAEYRSRIPLELFNPRAMKLGNQYNNALAAIENNNMGIATNLFFKGQGYPNIYEYQNPLYPGKSEIGFPTNTLTRPLLIEELSTCIRENVSGIQGIRTVNEMLNFAWIRKGASVKAEAVEGKHDDLVMSYGIGRYVRKTAPMEIFLPPIFS